MDEISKEVLDMMDPNPYGCSCGFSTSDWDALLAHFTETRDIPIHVLSDKTVHLFNTPGKQMFSRGKLVWTVPNENIVKGIKSRRIRTKGGDKDGT